MVLLVDDDDMLRGGVVKGTMNLDVCVCKTSKGIMNGSIWWIKGHTDRIYGRFKGAGHDLKLILSW